MKRSLVIDAGNTQIKFAVFEGMVLKDTGVINIAEPELLKAFVARVDLSVVSSVSLDVTGIIAFLDPLVPHIISSSTRLPFANKYATPETLGTDRLAAVAGGWGRFPGEHVLVIDCGTCITYDIITSGGDYLGGAISPGINMRLRAMHEFTQRLPLPTLEIPNSFIGNSTSSCLLSGAYYGAVNEINQTIARYELDFPGLKTLICGGDAGILEKQLKNNIFAAPNLVLEGLNQILYFNV